MHGKAQEFDRRFEDLKIQAEKLLREHPEQTVVLDETHDLLHEIQVYQAELEIQNEELRASQQELAASRDRYSYLFHEAPVGYVSLDRDGVIREANARIASMLKVDIASLIGKPLQNYIYAGDRGIYLGRYRAFYNSPEGKEMEVRLNRSDNSVVHTLIEGRSSSQDHRQVSRDTLVLLTVKDIDERVAAEANLRLADKVVQTAHEAVVVTDANVCILNVNPYFEETTGYKKHEVLGKNPRILKSGRHGIEFYRNMWSEITQSGFWQGIVWNRRKNGEEYAERLSISCIRNEKKEIMHFVGVFTDITKQLELEEQLRQSQKMEAVGTLAGGIAHDFNNVLAGIVGNNYLIRKEMADRPKALSRIDQIDDLCSHATQMISYLLTFARKDRFKSAPISMNDLLGQFSKSVVRVTLPENIRFDLQINAENLVVSADATQMQQILINLLSNSRHAVKGVESPSVTISLNRYQPDEAFCLQHNTDSNSLYAHICVADNGCGIMKDTMPRIFEPFYTTKSVGEGTGLGLSMVYGAIQNSNGFVSVDSTVGKGTRVHIYLPLVDERPVLSKTRLDWSVEAEALAGKELILVADDDVVIGNVIVDALGDEGYHVKHSDNGRALLDMFSEHADGVNLVILDMVMPEMGGWEAAETIRQTHPEMPIVFITGYDRDHVVSKHGVMDRSQVLSKPFQIHELAMVVRDMLDNG